MKENVFARKKYKNATREIREIAALMVKLLVTVTNVYD